MALFILFFPPLSSAQTILLPLPLIMATPATKPRVLIAGAGIGGIVLAIILEKAHIPYEIFERSTETRLLGWS